MREDNEMGNKGDNKDFLLVDDSLENKDELPVENRDELSVEDKVEVQDNFNVEDDFNNVDDDFN
ncbi:MAG: hypothetical protein RR840_05225, partial [Clostridium sp.]